MPNIYVEDHCYRNSTFWKRHNVISFFVASVMAMLIPLILLIAIQLISGAVNHALVNMGG
jgi:hypothetical protein